MPNLALAVAKYNADNDGIPKINFKGFLVGESFFLSTYSSALAPLV